MNKKDSYNEEFGTSIESVGDSLDGRMGSNETNDTLTNRQGHPVTDNQNVRTVGNRGPMTLENYDFLEKISHFDRERIPERVVHARGAGAHGYFESYGSFGDEPISKYTRAKLFQDKGKLLTKMGDCPPITHAGRTQRRTGPCISRLCPSSYLGGLSPLESSP